MLRGELESITLQQRMLSGYMEPLSTQLQLVMKMIFQICVNMHGMNGVISENKQQSFPTTEKFLGSVLGSGRGAGNEMVQWILKANDRVVPRRKLRPLKVDEIHSPVEIKKRVVFDALIERRCSSPIPPSNIQKKNVFEKYEDTDQQEQPTLEVEDIVDSTGKVINQI